MSQQSKDTRHLDLAQFEDRKRDHIDQSLREVHQAAGLSGLDRVRLEHEALPDLDFAEVSLKSLCLGQELATPFFIPGMTMGHSGAPDLNARLARACEARGWAMGVGSQRREFEGFESASEITREGSALRAAAPNAVLLANIGITQLRGVTVDQIQRLVGSIRAQGFVIHLNALQESLQPEGTPHFRGGLRAIEDLARALPVPVIVKETGCGMGESTLKRLLAAGVSAVDVSGLGGTHWGRIEGARSPAGSLLEAAAQTFAEWGISTVDSVRAASKVLSKHPGKGYSIWASGGVRNGLDAAKLVSLGAEQIGFAQPALRAALEGEAALDRWMERMEFELKVALFCTGSATPSALKGRGVHAAG